MDWTTRGKTVFITGAARGLGAETARRFLAAGLVDRISLFTGETTVGEEGIASPVTTSTPLPDFRISDERQFGGDRLIEYERIA